MDPADLSENIAISKFSIIQTLIRAFLQFLQCFELNRKLNVFLLRASLLRISGFRFILKTNFGKVEFETDLCEGTFCNSHSI